jgi:hypothetical protein
MPTAAKTRRARRGEENFDCLVLSDVVKINL